MYDWKWSKKNFCQMVKILIFCETSLLVPNVSNLSYIFKCFLKRQFEVISHIYQKSSVLFRESKSVFLKIHFCFYHLKHKDYKTLLILGWDSHESWMVANNCKNAKNHLKTIIFAHFCKKNFKNFIHVVIFHISK